MKVNARVTISLLLLLTVAGCRNQSEPPRQAAHITGLQVATVHAAQIPSSSPMVGSVRAKESASLSAQVFGRVEKVLVHEGDTVRAGQVLVRLDSTEARAHAEGAASSAEAAQQNLNSAGAQAALAASTLERYKTLRDQKSVSAQEFDEVARRSEAASAQFHAAQAQLAAQKAQAGAASAVAGYSIVTAPFAGIVTARHVDPGALAAPGVPLIDIERSGPMQLVVTVDESLLSQLRTHQRLEVSVPAASAEPIPGSVAQIVPAANESSHSFQVKIDLPSFRTLFAGMYGTVSLSASTRAAALVPAAAVVTHGSVHGVWVVDAQHIASLRYVTLGSTLGSEVEVLSGISPNEQVVLAPGDRELGGSLIEARP